MLEQYCCELYEIDKERERKRDRNNERDSEIDTERGRRFRQITAVKELTKANEIETGVNRKAGGED